VLEEKKLKISSHQEIFVVFPEGEHGWEGEHISRDSERERA